MARIRCIKPDFWTNEKIMGVSRNSRLLFIGMWNFADDAGRLSDAEMTLKAQIYPGDIDVNSTMVRGMIDELSSKGLLHPYVVEGRAYLQITGWDHQKIDRARPSKIPPPNSTNDRRGLATDLTLSNLRGTNLLSQEPCQKEVPPSLASALPAGALARGEKGKRPAEVSREELARIFAKKGGGAR